MAHRNLCRRLALLAATLLVAILASLPNHAVAQRNGNRPGRGSGDNNRPAETRPASPAPAAAGFGTVSENERIRKFASDTIKKHDQNGDGILEGDELKGLRDSSRAETSGDGKITHNELVAFYTPKTADKSTPQSVSKPTAETKLSAESLAKRRIVNTTRKSYRFKTTKERLKTWRFASKDTNGDGQVSMSEYSRSWSDRTAAEFGRYDKDNDGMFTAAEAK
jgi:Ca2+-binding EF-hand superfamily protein